MFVESYKQIMYKTPVDWNLVRLFCHAYLIKDDEYSTHYVANLLQLTCDWMSGQRQCNNNQSEAKIILRVGSSERYMHAR